MTSDDFIIQVILSLLSLTVLIPYSRAYILGCQDMRNGVINPNRKAIFMYHISVYSMLIWYIMPFISQPRMFGVYTLIQKVTLWNLFYCIVCFTLFLYLYFMWGTRSVKMNLKATKDKFYAPKKLLTSGIYGKVQHPMIISDILAHFALILFTGSLYTFFLFPVYVIINAVMVKVQIKYSLKPYFKDELEEYKKKVPAYFNKTLTLITVLLITLLIINIIYYLIMFNHLN